MNRTLLIAEDDPQLLEVLALQFDWRGYRVLRARDGEEVLRQLAQRPDVILLDIMMPRKNGYEVCRSLKSHPAHRDLPVILVSGRKAETDREWGLECGADAYITKPFGISQLEAEVEKLLERLSSPPAAAAAASAGREESAGGRVVRHWTLEPLAARVYRQKYGELAYRRLWRELPLELGRHLDSWGVRGWGLRNAYGVVCLELPGPGPDVEACLERLVVAGNDFLRSCYGPGDMAREAVVLHDPGAEDSERRLPLLRLVAQEGAEGEDSR